MEENRDSRYIKKLEMPVWRTRAKNGKGSKIFLGNAKAEEVLHSGCFIYRICKAGDLR